MRGIFKNRGITLIELMITLVVLVVLISLAAPAMTSVLDNRRVAGASQAIYEQIQYARTEAIKQSRDMVLVVRPQDGSDWCLGTTDNPAACDCTVTDVAATNACTLIGAVVNGTPQRVLRRVSAESFPTITMTAPQANAQIRFSFVRGTVTEGEDTPIRIVSPRGLERTATVNVLGRIQTQ